MSKVKRILGYYEPRIRPGRAPHDILDWNSAASQITRFEVLADNVDLCGRKLLDVGCGLGDLLGFLRSRGVSADYTGVDLSSKMIDTARGRLPGGRFMCTDVFADGEAADDAEVPFGREAFDVIFCSGVFNLNLGNNDRFIPAAVSRLTELARRYVVFNLLHTRAGDLGRTYVYFHPDEVLAAIRPLGWEIRLIDDYLPNDFTVICRRPPTDTHQPT